MKNNQKINESEQVTMLINVYSGFPDEYKGKLAEGIGYAFSGDITPVLNPYQLPLLGQELDI